MVLRGRYELRRTLGSGGLGIVVQAHDRDLDRPVAIKVLRDRGGGSAEHLTRLVREANAMARISHPNVVQVFDVLRYDGLTADPGMSALPRSGVAIVMELVRGEDLSSWLQTARSPDEVMDVFMAAGRGLAAAHTRGVVHRDFKPGNVLLGEGGTVKVTDFGVAAACIPTQERTSANPALAPDPDESIPDVDQDAWLVTSQLTRTGGVVGTPAYMAPEQHRGKTTDARTDQFAFCLALVEALSGRRPVRGRTFAELLENKLNLQIPATDRISSRVAPALARGLSPLPHKRFATMDGLLHAIDPTRRPASKRVVGAALGGVAVLSVMLLSSGRGVAPAPTVADNVAAMPSVAVTAEMAPGWSAQRVAVADRPPRFDSGPGAERRAIYAEMAVLRRFEDPDVPAPPKLANVERLFERARALGDGPLLADLMLSRASLEVADGRLEEGRETAQQAFAMALEHGSHVLAARAAALSFAYHDDDSPEAERWRRTAETEIALAGGEPRAEKYLEDQLARVAARAGRLEEALVHGERLVLLSEEVEGIDSPRVGYAHKWNAMYLEELGDFVRAEQELTRGVEILRRHYPDTHPSVLRGRGNLVSILFEQGRTGEAMVELDRALADLDRRIELKGADWVAEEVLWDAGDLMQNLERHEEALAYFERIVPLLPDRADYWNGFSLHQKMSESLLALDRPADAAKALRAGLKYVSADSSEWEQRAEARATLARIEAQLETTASAAR